MARLVLVLALICAVATASPDVRRGDIDEERLRVTLDAVGRAVSYMGAHSRSANLDGGIGVRSIEGQFGSLLARYWTKLPLWAVTRLKAIQTLAARVAKETQEAVRRNTPMYYANAGQLLDSHSWDTYFPARQLPMNSVAELLKEARKGGQDDFDEEFSDNCIRDFYGSEGRAQCSISRRCWDTMAMSEGRQDYFLTHQVFYLLTGINANCLYNLTVMAKASLSAADTATDGQHPVRALLDQLCSRILVAATLLEKRGFPVADRDLFMEQVGLCGLAGYTGEFAQPHWWSIVIGWQRANGCYGAFPGEQVAPENFNPSRYGNYRRRRKRAEALMSSDGCLSHRTSVAMDAMVAFTRRWVEAMTAGHAGQHE